MPDRQVLDPVLRSALDVVFVGTSPGPESLKRGVYYANRDNCFYQSLHQAGITKTCFDPDSFSLLPEAEPYAIGLDDVYEDAPALVERLRSAVPFAVCFNSKQAFIRFVRGSCGLRLRSREFGCARVQGSMLKTVHEQLDWTPPPPVWVIPDSSPAAKATRPRRVQLLRELAESISRHKSRVKVANRHSERLTVDDVGEDAFPEHARATRELGTARRS